MPEKNLGKPFISLNAQQRNLQKDDIARRRDRNIFRATIKTSRYNFGLAPTTLTLLNSNRWQTSLEDSPKIDTISVKN